MEDIGFIILRHVNDELTNNYWLRCYSSIRCFYPESPVLIIDDNSNYQFITNEQLYKTQVINSQFPGRGELLPYYYYLNNKFANTAVILHDSVFINKYIDFTVNNYKLLWEFEHGYWDQIDDERKMINTFNDKELLEFYETRPLWRGCFGGMSIITHNYLSFINNKYPISNLLDLVTSRYNRCSFERVIACLLQKNCPKETLLGNIHDYCRWGIKFSECDNYKHLPLLKVWTGR